MPEKRADGEWWQVDADTKVYPDSMSYLVRAMQHDSMVMGVCGETRIGNKRQSWVTMIQVFESVSFLFDYRKARELMQRPDTSSRTTSPRRSRPSLAA